MKKAIKLYIKGNVQGVTFRASIKEKADNLDLSGYVRNLEDGRVEVFVQGDIDKVKALAEFCKSGPGYAQVRNIEVKEEKLQDYKDFKILHF